MKLSKVRLRRTTTISDLPKVSVNIQKRVPFVSVVGKKKSGKTTLIERLVSLLKLEGYKVGVMKYDVREFQIDYKGKDTYRYYHSGADIVVISSQEKVASIRRLKASPPLEELLHTHFSDADLVLIEGYKADDCPKIFLLDPGEEPSLREKKDCLVLVKGDQSVPSSKDIEEALNFLKGLLQERR